MRAVFCVALRRNRAVSPADISGCLTDFAQTAARSELPGSFVWALRKMSILINVVEDHGDGGERAVESVFREDKLSTWHVRTLLTF